MLYDGEYTEGERHEFDFNGNTFVATQRIYADGTRDVEVEAFDTVDVTSEVQEYAESLFGGVEYER